MKIESEGKGRVASGSGDQQRRRVEFDMAKCFALVFMILLHCLMVASGFSNAISIHMRRIVGQLLGEPYAAPVFMFSMGIGIVYSRNHSPLYLVKRGIKLLILGVAVNIGEFFIPHFLAGYFLGNWDIFSVAGGLLLFCVDILAFAGMAMIAFGVFVRLGLSDDFYEEPEMIRSKILTRELDGQLLEISGIKDNYDCETREELEAAISSISKIMYFPSAENGKVTAKSVELKRGDRL